ncbi:MAG TPA: cohesin domain-containing protein [Patescibacteria group bacterium]|nr:cohesin domain-containing protein [Patescibacteria group bacterium]
MDKTAKIKEKILFFNRDLSWQATALILLVFSFIAILILIEGKISFPQNLFQKKTQPLSENEINLEEDASLVGQIYLSPSEQMVSLGEKVVIEVWIDSQEKKLDSVDIKLNYQPELVKIISLEKSDLFEEFPELNWDEETGQIVIRAISFQDNEFSGKGMVAQIIFQSLKAGITEIGVDFIPQETLDCNLVDSETSQDILGKATGAQIEIGE